MFITGPFLLQLLTSINHPSDAGCLKSWVNNLIPGQQKNSNQLCEQIVYKLEILFLEILSGPILVLFS
jgi:hypothetical protein